MTETVKLVNNFLAQFVQEKTSFAAEYDLSYERLWKEISDYLLNGGKRIRPHLVVLTYQAYGGKDIEKMLPAAVAWELLHQSLLVHDDIIDRDDVRHGTLNITGGYKQHYEGAADKDHLASSAALLAGDLLLSSAHELVLSSSLDDSKKIAVQRLLADALYVVVGGELMDTEAVVSNVEEVDVLKIAQYKTVSYSCEYPMLCGAELANAPVAETEKLRRMATAIGIGYQLVDDLLGVFGEKALTGKSVDGDIREKKRTLLVQRTYEMLPIEKQEKLYTLYNSGELLNGGDREFVRKAIIDSGAKAKIEQEIERCNTDALKVIEELSISEIYKEQYRLLVTRLLKRES